MVATSADFRSWQLLPVMVILSTCSASSFYTICSKMSINAVRPVCAHADMDHF